MRAKSHACCRHTLTDVQERGERRSDDEAVDEIMRPPSSPTLLSAVNEVAKRTGFSASESHSAGKRSTH